MFSIKIVVIISIIILLICIMVNYNEPFYRGGGHGRGGRHYGGGGGYRRGGRYRGGGNYYGGGWGGYGFPYPYYLDWDYWYPPYGGYPVYEKPWKQCPQGTICPPYLSCLDPQCQ